MDRSAQRTGWAAEPLSAGFLIPLFAWLARQESIRKGKAVRLGMEKARNEGKAVGRPVVMDKVDAALVVRLRSQGRSWREIAEAHPAVKSASGRKVRPSVGSIRRAFELRRVVQRCQS